jgi:hypothetical protein
MKQKIAAFRQDDDGHWVAELECGHSQHVRHDPPWQNRPWVKTKKDRAKRIGLILECAKCNDAGNVG